MGTVIESGVTKNQVIAALSRSPHGKLEEYVPIAREAIAGDAEFYGHLISWNQVKGSIRDSKVALPVIGIKEGLKDEFRENALAHLAILDPRNLCRAIAFNKDLGGGRFRVYRDLVNRYLKSIERNYAKWERKLVQHRESMTRLYGQFHVKPGALQNQIMFERMYPAGSVFQVIKDLGTMSATEAAGQILNRKIPFLIAAGALGAKAKEPELVLALINQMSATELVTNSKRLKKMGVDSNPSLRAAYANALEKARGSSANLLKTSVAADAMEEVDEAMAEKLRNLQERQLENVKVQKGVEGNWIVAADKSGSMGRAIDAGRQIAALLAKMVKGNVYLIFFDTAPRLYNATGKSYEAIVKETRNITANGGTSMGCVLQYALDAKLDFDGITVVSDGGENSSPAFAAVYPRIAKMLDKEPPVYLYLLRGEPNVFTQNLKRANIDIQEFDIRFEKDFYSLPNLVQTMNVSRYDLVQEVLASKLLTLDFVLGAA